MQQGIIMIHLGGAGIASADLIWQKIQKECQVNDFRDQASPINVNLNPYFIEKETKILSEQYIPRAILVDTDGDNMNFKMKNSLLKNKISKSQIIQGKEDCSDLFSKGFYNEGKVLIGRIKDEIRKLAERSDKLQGFQLIRSFSGGTGSGLGSLILQSIQDEFTKQINIDFNHIKDSNFHIKRPNYSDNMVADYNTVMAFEQSSDLRILFQKRSLYNLIQKRNQILENQEECLDMDLDGINEIFSQIVVNFNQGILNSTSGNCNNSSLKEIQTNLVCYPRLNVISCLFGGPTNQDDGQNILNQSIDYENSTIETQKISKYKTISSNFFFMGNKIENNLLILKNLNNPYFKAQIGLPSFIPTGIKYSFLNKTPFYLQKLKSNNGNPTLKEENFFSQTLINSTNVTDVLQTIQKNFHKMNQFGFFQFWYQQDGFLRDEFRSCQSVYDQLILDYQEIQKNEKQDQEIEENQ